MFLYGFINTINNPTRITDSSATLTDNIFINCIDCSFFPFILYADMSDHLPICIIVELNVKVINNNLHISKREDNQANILAFVNELNAQVWEFNSNLDQIDPSTAFFEFHNTYYNLLNKFCPIKNETANPKFQTRKSWVSPGLVKCCLRKAKLYKKLINNPSLESKAKFNRTPVS